MLNDPASLSSAGAWSMNVCSSVGLIMTNKAIMSNKGILFKFPTCLTAFHFITTALVGLATHALQSWGSARRGGAAGDGSGRNAPGPAEGDKERRMSTLTMLWFSAVASLAVVTMNLSLMLNSVGFYQIAKLSIIPSCCFFEALLHGKTYSRPVKLAVVIVMAGVAICTVTDVTVSMPGLIAAVAAVLSTTFQQIYIGQLQKKYSIGSFDLLSKTAPYQAVMLVALGPPVDYILGKKSLLSYTPTSVAVSFIGLSCLLALLVNLSMYLCISKFSAVSFQVLGHMKTLLVLALGWCLFGATVSLKNILGMAVAVVGMVAYSWAVEKEKANKTQLPTKRLDAEKQRLLDGDKRKN